MSPDTLTDAAPALEQAVRRCHERGVVIPTFAQMRDPQQIPHALREDLRPVGLWDVHPRNLFRITWRNDPDSGGYGDVNCLEFPSALTGVRARIFALVGRNFPTGAHKVGAAFGCLAPRLVSGQFDPSRHLAVWPSTGNYCRGGAFVASLLGCRSLAILPEEMSPERFAWLRDIGAEVWATPGCESNVKEIYDACHRLRAENEDAVILNQFEEFGNGLWHYEVTASAIDEVLRGAMAPGDRLAAYVSSTGSAGTIAAGDRLKELYPAMKIVASEALQCPTLLENGYGAHRIEGIGDKHVPWIHNVRNTDVVVAIDDNDPLALLRFFHEPEGRARLKAAGVADDFVAKLDLLGISGIANVLAAIQTARWFELTERDVVFTVCTDSLDLYRSRLAEQQAAGPYSEAQAAFDYTVRLERQHTAHLRELTHADKRRIHNLKYYTWVEQQGKDVAELDAQWHDHDSYWPERWSVGAELDRQIVAFNDRVARYGATH